MSNKQRKQTKSFICDKTEKESLTEVYKDSKNCEERLQIEKTNRQPKSKKNLKKWISEKGRKNTERQKKREQVDRDEQQGGNKEGKQTLKKGKCWIGEGTHRFSLKKKETAKTETNQENVFFLKWQESM